MLMGIKQKSPRIGPSPNERPSSEVFHAFQTVRLANAISTRLLWKVASKFEGFQEVCAEIPALKPHGTEYDIYTAMFFSNHVGASSTWVQSDLKPSVELVLAHFLDEQSVESIQPREQLEIVKALKGIFEPMNSPLSVREIYTIVKEEFDKISKRSQGVG